MKTPTFAIHDLDAEDEVEYRLEVVTKLWTAYSNEFSITLQRVSGELFYISAIITIQGTCNIKLKKNILFFSSLQSEKK